MKSTENVITLRLHKYAYPALYAMIIAFASFQAGLYNAEPITKKVYVDHNYSILKAFSKSHCHANKTTLKWFGISENGKDLIVQCHILGNTRYIGIAELYLRRL